MSGITRISADDVHALVVGAEFFGSSLAGPNVEHMQAWAIEVLERCGPVPLVPADQLSPDTLCAATGGVGSVTATLELLPSGDEPVAVLRALQDQLGRPLGAVMPMNAASCNALFPLIAAAELGVPLVDCDGMGRVLPLITQTSYALAGLPLTPMTAISPIRELVSIDASGPRAELLIRGMLETAGGWMVCGLYPTEAANLVTGAINGSVSRAVRVGRLLIGTAEREGLLRGLGNTVSATVLGSGRVVEMGPSDQRGVPTQPADPTTVVVREWDGRGKLIRLEAQNEFLLAVIDGEPTTAVPDQLFLFDRHSVRMKGLEYLGLGDEVDVLAVPAAPVWHTRAGLALAGPKAFGLPVRHPKEL